MAVGSGFADDGEALRFGELGVLGGDFEQEATGGFAEQVLGGGRVVEGGDVGEIDLEAGLAAEAHFSQGDGETAFADVVGAEDHALLHELMVAAVIGEGFRVVEIGGSGEAHIVFRATGDEAGEDAAGEAAGGLADQGHLVAGLADAGADHVLGLLDNAEAADEQGAGDADGAFVGLEVVVEGVLAGDKGGAIDLGGLGHAFDALDQRAEFFVVIGVADAEVVENGDALRIGAHGDELAVALIHAGAAHEVGVSLAPLRKQGQAQGHQLLAAVDTDD